MLLADGSLEPVRCGASNRCSYCAMFVAIENSLVIKLDAQLCMPTVGVTTTTRAPDFGFKRLRAAEQALWRQLRRDYAELEIRYVGFLEWTTGEGTRARGHRRPHVHHLVKGFPPDHNALAPIEYDDAAGERVITTELELRVRELWHRFTADAWIAEARPLRTPAGAIAYLTLHHHKREQGPPPGFTGRRLRPSKPTKERAGYYELPIAELRALARELSSSSRVRQAVTRVLDAEIFGRAERDEVDLDVYMSEAIVDALRGFRPSTPVLQLDLEGKVDVDAADREQARRDLIERTLVELARVRAEEPPHLVYVRERDEVDPDTGELYPRVLAVLGPVEARRRPRPVRHERPPAPEVQLRIVARTDMSLLASTPPGDARAADG